jgi:lysyl-tRNA synthetase class 2
LFPVSHYSEAIKNNFSEETKDSFTQVCVAGRIMSIKSKLRKRRMYART